MRNLKKVALIFGISIIVLSVFNLTYAATGVVNTPAVRVRQKASTDSEVLTKAYEGEKLEILGEEGDWYKVKINGKTGYTRKDLIKEEKETTKNNTSNNNISTYETPENNTVSNEVVENNTTTEKTEPRNIIKEDVSLKLLPNFASNDIKLLTKGQNVELKKELNNWIEVSINDTTGWLLKNKLGTEAEVNTTTEQEQKPEDKNNETKPDSTQDKPTTPEKTTEPEKQQTDGVRNTKGKINVETANVRAKAEKSSSIIAHLDVGDEVTIVEEIGDWYKITNSEVSTGYVAKHLVTISDVTSRNTSESRKEINNEIEIAETSTATATGSAVVEFAKKYLGTAYVLGGKTPETGFDCSGYTRYVFKNFGYSLGTVAAAQDTVGTEVSRNELKEGDLILFYDEAKTKIGHTGIYIGGDQFIHAANPQRGVVIDGFSTNSYYSTRFVTARRIVE